MGTQNITNINCTPEETRLVEERKNFVYKTWSLLPESEIKYRYKDDLISAGFVGLCKGVKSWDGDISSINNYCITCIRNALINTVIRISRKQQDVIDIDRVIYKQGEDSRDIKLSDTLSDPLEHVEETCVDRQTARELIKIMYRVCTKREIEVLEVYCNEFKNQAEIAKDFGVSRTAIGRLMKNAREKILKKYEKSDVNA